MIGLGPNLFYGTQIPACILIMRPNGKAKPKERQGRILFINADQDYEAGRRRTTFVPSMPRRSSAPSRITRPIRAIHVWWTSLKLSPTITA